VGFGQHSLATNITLLKATEVDEIFEGNDDRYKAVSMNNAEAASASRDTPKPKRSGTWVSSVPSNSHHLDAVPCCTPLARTRTGRPKVRTFPLWFVIG
jgi:SWI/SNF-related matrix-associated actin-dependent regulator of chromatin subfamily B protein 1